MPPPKDLIADKACNADEHVHLPHPAEYLAGDRADAKPPRHTAIDPVAYRMRNLIERAVCKLKNWRAITTRYDKAVRNLIAGICLVLAVTAWIR